MAMAHPGPMDNNHDIPKIRGKISSDVSDLECLHLLYPWLPNAASIRPSPETLERKKARLLEIEDQWASFTDYILHSVFDQPIRTIMHDGVAKKAADDISDTRLQSTGTGKGTGTGSAPTASKGSGQGPVAAQITIPVRHSSASAAAGAAAIARLNKQQPQPQPTQPQSQKQPIQYKFQPNEFPYAVRGNHWVLWVPTKEQSISDEEITATIDRAIRELSGGLDYDFAWYINPRMTIPEFFHTQVFFRVGAVG